MERIELNPSGVVFNEHNHTYMLGDKKLKGITGMIGSQLFPEKYDGIPQYVLDRAAEYGSSVHSTIELCDSLGDHDNPDPMYQAYRRLLFDEGLEPIANEYIVTDREYFATPIDVLAQDKEGYLAIIDIKTTSKHDGDYVSWQGSVCKKLFEITNPHLVGRVKSIYTMWLPKPTYGHPTLFKEVMRDEADVEGLMRAEIEGRRYAAPAVAHENALSLTEDAIAEVVNVEQTLAEMKERSNELRAGLLLAMQEHGVKSFKCDRFMLTRVVPSGAPSYTLDTERLKAEHPEIWEAYKKEKKQASESIKIKLY